MKTLSYLFVVILFFTQCKKSGTPPQALPDLGISFNQNLDSTIQKIASDKNCRIVLKAQAKDGRLHYTGYDGRTHEKITIFNDIMEFGSCTKMFTATCILKLVEENKISLEDRLTLVLPSDTIYKNLLVIDGKDYIDSVTIRELLNHSSGIPDYFNGDDDAEIAMHGDTSLRFTPYQLITLAKETNPPSFIPGMGFKYSNTGYILLGLIIEKLSGTTYESYVQQHILDPLGMKHTFFGTTNPPAERAPGHYKGVIHYFPFSLAWSAGEIVSTLDDMDLFIRGWYEGKLFSPAAVQTVQTQYFLTLDSTYKINYGLGVIDLTNTHTLGHEGGTFGFQSYIGHLPNGCSYTLTVDEGSAGTVSGWELSFAASATLEPL